MFDFVAMLIWSFLKKILAKIFGKINKSFIVLPIFTWIRVHRVPAIVAFMRFLQVLQKCVHWDAFHAREEEAPDFAEHTLFNFVLIDFDDLTGATVTGEATRLGREGKESFC